MGGSTKQLTASLSRQRRDGIVDVYAIPNDPESVEFRDIVGQWPISRIATLREKTKLPVARIVALLGISQPAYSKMCSGDFTPSPALCRRMQQLEVMADRGELHREYIPSTAEMRRRMALFRAWWLRKPPSVDLPLITCHLQVRWGKGVQHLIVIPVKHIPQLRLREWTGLVAVIKTVTVALRKLAQGNARILWKQAEEDYWYRYARDTLPAIVTERAKILPKANAARKSVRERERNPEAKR